ncbi:MAG: FHA domain-containing protein, partial [Gammaproteobacteria bacterium]|nr:FHA domain-containing protein [Gammaproteobacteria bacterium]
MAKLVTTLDDDSVREYPLDKGCIAVGRHEDNDIRLDNHTVSNHHADILVHQNVYLEDCKSTNGTYLNGRRITRGRLKHGDMIHFGKQQFKFVDRNDEDHNVPLDTHTESQALVKTTEAAQAIARVRVLNGLRAGEVQVLDQVYNTVGISGTQVAVIAKRS